MQFGRFLEALNAKGRVAAAEHYEKLVADRFKDTLSKEQIRLLEVDQIVTILHVADIVKEAQFNQPSPLQQYVLELKARGFTVSLGENYRDK